MLGEGSFGRVYRARQRSTGRDVAVKALRPNARPRARESKSAVERFKRELRVGARLAHPNVVRLIDSGETANGTLYAVFEHVPGVTLKDLLANEGRLSLRETTHLMAQVLDALSSAHALAIVHRDLTPTNIIAPPSSRSRRRSESDPTPSRACDSNTGSSRRAARAWRFDDSHAGVLHAERSSAAAAARTTPPSAFSAADVRRPRRRARTGATAASRRCSTTSSTSARSRCRRRPRWTSCTV